jgi:hypothetical protein
MRKLTSDTQEEEIFHDIGFIFATIAAHSNLHIRQIILKTKLK